MGKEQNKQTVRDGKIASLREYMDTHHVKQVFIDDA